MSFATRVRSAPPLVVALYTHSALDALSRVDRCSDSRIAWVASAASIRCMIYPFATRVRSAQPLVVMCLVVAVVRCPGGVAARSASLALLGRRVCSVRRCRRAAGQQGSRCILRDIALLLLSYVQASLGVQRLQVSNLEFDDVSHA